MLRRRCFDNGVSQDACDHDLRPVVPTVVAQPGSAFRLGEDDKLTLQGAFPQKLVVLACCTIAQVSNEVFVLQQLLGVNPLVERVNHRGRKL